MRLKECKLLSSITNKAIIDFYNITYMSLHNWKISNDKRKKERINAFKLWKLFSKFKRKTVKFKDKETGRNVELTIPEPLLDIFLRELNEVK